MNARLEDALAHWGHVAPLLVPAKSEADYLDLVEALDAVLDAGGANEAHPLASLAAALGDLVSAWETAQQPMPAAMSGAEALAFFMRRDGLRQADMPEIGSQGVVSELLSGKRVVNLRQAKALAKRFGVPLEMFAHEAHRIISMRKANEREIAKFATDPD